jgi:hypothetical protein
MAPLVVEANTIDCGGELGHTDGNRKTDKISHHPSHNIFYGSCFECFFRFKVPLKQLRGYGQRMGMQPGNGHHHGVNLHEIKINFS